MAMAMLALTRSRPMCGADRGTAARIIRAATLLALAHGASSGFRLNARQLGWGVGTQDPSSLLLQLGVSMGPIREVWPYRTC